MSRPTATFPFSTDGVEIAQTNNTTIPSGSRGYIGIGINGSTLRFITVDSIGNQVLVGSGSA